MEPPDPADPAFASAETLRTPSAFDGARGTNPVPPEVSGAPADARFGRYVRILLLGAGAMGEVWKAWDLELNRWVALKFLKGGDAEEIARFDREAQIAGTLSHPNIAAVYGAGTEQGRRFLAMQFIAGSTLKSLPLDDPRLIARLVRDAARAVGFAHERGIIHRDIKPENLMVSVRLKAGTGRHSREGESRHHLFVTDFGLARSTEAASSLSVTGTVMGTPAYMAPEQARAEALDGRADVYSLGATLYALLAGRPPFEGGNVYELLRRVQDEEPASLSRVKPGIPHELEVIARKAMMKDRDRRYESAVALADDLDRWLEGEPIEARPASVLYRIGKRISKRRGVVATAGAGIAVCAALLAVFLPRLGRQGDALTAAQRRLVGQMRVMSDTCLEAAISLRRSGDLAGMNKFSTRLEEICGQVSAELPTLAEPYFRLGRLYRAQMRNDEALAQQERALALDPRDAGALYERVVLAAVRVRTQALQSVQEGNSVLGPWRAAGDDEGSGASIEESVRQDPESAARLDGIRRDLEALGARTEGLSEAELDCARGLHEWIRGALEKARGRFAAAISKSPELSDAYEALAGLECDAKRYEESIAWWSRGIEHDKGYAGHREGRAFVRYTWASALHRQRQPLREIAEAAVADATEVIRLLPDQPIRRLLRARIYSLMASDTAGTPESWTAVDAALADSSEAVKRLPGRVECWQTHAMLLTLRVQQRRQSRQPDEEAIKEALAAIDQGLEVANTSVSLHLLRAATCQSAGDWRYARGLDAIPWYDDALKSHDRVLELRPDFNPVRALRAQVRMKAGNARRDRGQPAEACYQDSLRDYAVLEKAGPGLGAMTLSRGATRWNRIQMLFTLQQSIDDAVDEAVAELETYVQGVPEVGQPSVMIGRLHVMSALEAQRRKADPEPAFRRAAAAFGRAETALKGQPAFLIERSTLLLHFADWMRNRDRSAAERSYRAGIADIEGVLRKVGNNGQAWENLAWGRQQLATLVGLETEEARAMVAGAIDAQTHVLELNATQSKTRFERAANCVCMAGFPQPEADKIALLKRALDDLAMTLRLDPSSADRVRTVRAVAQEKLKALTQKDY